MSLSGMNTHIPNFCVELIMSLDVDGVAVGLTQHGLSRFKEKIRCAILKKERVRERDRERERTISCMIITALITHLIM